MLCVLVALLLCFASMTKPALAQTAQTGIKVNRENVALTRTSYPSVRPSEGPVRIYLGEWQLKFTVINYDVVDDHH